MFNLISISNQRISIKCVNNCLDHNYAVPSAKEVVQRRDFMLHSLEDLEAKVRNVQRRKRRLACKNETLLSQLEEAKDKPQLITLHFHLDAVDSWVDVYDCGQNLESDFICKNVFLLI